MGVASSTPKVTCSGPKATSSLIVELDKPQDFKAAAPSGSESCSEDRAYVWCRNFGVTCPFYLPPSDFGCLESPLPFLPSACGGEALVSGRTRTRETQASSMLVLVALCGGRLGSECVKLVSSHSAPLVSSPTDGSCALIARAAQSRASRHAGAFPCFSWSPQP